MTDSKAVRITTGWSLARINREAFIRDWAVFADESNYHPARDGQREHDWVWAINAMRDELSPAALDAAHRFARLRRIARGDIEHCGQPRVDSICSGYEAGFWMREAASRRAARARYAVVIRDDCTPMRLATFNAVFHWREPRLACIREIGRPGGVRYNAAGQPIRMNEGKTKLRIAWCAEALAEHFGGTEK